MMSGWKQVLIRKGNYHVPHPNYKRVVGYKSRKGNPRLGIAVVRLRNHYKLPINAISEILDVSQATVHRKICFSRLCKYTRRFDGSKRRFRYEVKIVNSKGKVYGLRRLVLRFLLWLQGDFKCVEEVTGDEPP